MIKRLGCAEHYIIKKLGSLFDNQGLNQLSTCSLIVLLSSINLVSNEKFGIRSFASTLLSAKPNGQDNKSQNNSSG